MDRLGYALRFLSDSRDEQFPDVQILVRNDDIPDLEDVTADDQYRNFFGRNVDENDGFDLEFYEVVFHQAKALMFEVDELRAEYEYYIGLDLNERQYTCDIEYQMYDKIRQHMANSKCYMMRLRQMFDDAYNYFRQQII